MKRILIFLWLKVLEVGMVLAGALILVIIFSGIFKLIESSIMQSIRWDIIGTSILVIGVIVALISWLIGNWISAGEVLRKEKTIKEILFN